MINNLIKTVVPVLMAISWMGSSNFDNSAGSHGENPIKKSRSVGNHLVVTFNDSVKVKVGDMAPDIAFRDSVGVTGNDVRLKDFKRKYVLIDVWATWCYPCRIQQPHLEALEKKMAGKEITFLSISLDTQLFRWKGRIQSMHGLQWMVRDTTFEKFYGIYAIPRFILLDKKGRILNLNMPLPSNSELEQQLMKLEGI